MKPLIGITTGEIINEAEPWDVSSYGQKYEYSDAVLAAGGIPILIPFMPEAELRSVYGRLDGILFAGGNDINPELYHEAVHPKTVDLSGERDRVESLLMTWALADNKPILAICRGFQLLNIVAGGSLHQDIATHIPGSADHRLSTNKHDGGAIAHTLTLDPHSLLAVTLSRETIPANSRHHQAINTVAPSLNAVAWAEDGIIEAVEDPTKNFVIGVQCHPESLVGKHPTWARVFQAFVKASIRERRSISTLLKLKKIPIVKNNKIY